MKQKIKNYRRYAKWSFFIFSMTAAVMITAWAFNEVSGWLTLTCLIPLGVGIVLLYRSRELEINSSGGW